MDGFEKDRQLLVELVEHTGLDGTKLARRIGVAPSTLGRSLSGAATTRLSMRTIEKLSTEFPDFPGWSQYLASISESGVLNVPSRSFNYARSTTGAEPDPDSLAIPMLELGYGMGGSFLDDIDPGEVVKQFPRDFIRMYTRAPADLLCFSYGIGDSMEPTITDRDVLLIDLSRKSITMSEQIWVFSSGGIGMVKRARVIGGKVILMSDNSAVPDYEPAEDELQIIGRVVAVVKRT